MAARMARRSIFDRDPLPSLGFVQEEVTPRRPVGGAAARCGQLERLLEVGRLRNVPIQVMPTHREEHPGTGGLIEVLKFPDGSAVGRLRVPSVADRSPTRSSSGSLSCAMG